MSCLNYLGNSTHIGDIGENVAIAEFLKEEFQYQDQYHKIAHMI